MSATAGRKIKHALILLLLAAAGLFQAFPAHAQLLPLENGENTAQVVKREAKAADTEKSDNSLEDVTPDEIISKLNTDAKKTENWFARERRHLLNFLIGSAASILAGVFLTWLFRRLTRFRMDRGEHALRWEILHVLTMPVILLLVLTSCFLFFFPVLRSLPRTLHELDMRFFYAAATLVIAWGILGLVTVMDRKIRKFAERSDNSLDNLTVSLIGNTLKIAIGITTVLFIGQNIFRLDITALLAGAGVIGLAIALAAKDTVSNFFGTVVIIADCPFRLGDRIKTGDVNGIVTHVGMRSSKIRTENDSVYTIPNSILTNATVCKVNRSGHIKHVMDIGLTYDTTPEQMKRAMEILHEIMDNFHGPDAGGCAPRIYFSQFGPSALNIHAIIWFKTDSFDGEEALLNELNMTILTRFNEAGLNFAYPTQTIYLENIPQGK